MVGAPTHLTFAIDEEPEIESQVVHDTDPSWWPPTTIVSRKENKKSRNAPPRYPHATLTRPKEGVAQVSGLYSRRVPVAVRDAFAASYQQFNDKSQG